MAVGLLTFITGYLSEVLLTPFFPDLASHRFSSVAFVNNAMSKGLWVLVGIGFYGLSLLSKTSDHATRKLPPDYWPSLLAVLLIYGPILYFIAQSLVYVIKITAVGSWSSEGRIFVAPYWYFNMFRILFPYTLAGLLLLAGLRLQNVVRNK
jgi:hypothetical protein